MTWVTGKWGYNLRSSRRESRGENCTPSLDGGQPERRAEGRQRGCLRKIKRTTIPDTSEHPERHLMKSWIRDNWRESRRDGGGDEMSPGQSLYGKVTSRQVRLRIFYQLSSLPHLRASAQPRITKASGKGSIAKSKAQNIQKREERSQLEGNGLCWHMETWGLWGSDLLTFLYAK